MSAVEILLYVGHVARYLLGAAVAGGVFLIESAVFVLPVAALTAIGNGVVGGVSAVVIGFLMAFLLGLVLIVTVVFPAVLAGELVARRTRWSAAPLVVLGVLLVTTVGLSVLYSVFEGGGGDFLGSIFMLYASLLLPALAYALIAYPAEWLARKAWALARAGWRRVTAKA